MPDDFNFSLTYGTYAKQKIDTFNNVVIKDLVIFIQHMGAVVK